MASIQSPATVAILLKKAKGAYQKAKPDAKSKAEARHTAIVKDLQRMREMARKKTGPDGPKLVKPFNARRQILLKKLTEHRKKLNSPTEKNADPNKGTLPAFTKALIKLTQAVLMLDFNTVTAEEESNIALDGLEEGDLAALDALDAISESDLAALEKTDNADLPEGEGEKTREGAEAEQEEEAAPKADQVDAVALLKRFIALTSVYQTAIAKPGPHVAVLQTQFTKARALIDAKDFAPASKAIDGLEALLNKIKSTLPAATDGPTTAVVGWKAARVEATQKLRNLEAIIAKTKHPLAGETVALIEVIVKRLVAEPATKAAAAELAAFVATDPGVTDIEEAVVESQSFGIRTQLVSALEALQAQLPA
jgi:hypothetical protein